MSSKTQLGQLKKDELVNTILSLEQKVNKISEDEGYEKLSKQLDALLKENQRLREELDSAKKSEKFVAIEHLSVGEVWLPSPESKSGRQEDANKGYLLKKQGEIAIIPAFWMIEYIANRNPAFTMGDVRVNNERGRTMSPSIEFAELDIPDEFYDGAVPPEDILANVKKGGEHLEQFIKKYDNKPFVLAKIMNTIDGVIEDYDDEDPKKLALIPITERLNRKIVSVVPKENK